MFGRKKKYWVEDRQKPFQGQVGQWRRVAGSFNTREEAQAKANELEAQVEEEYLNAPMFMSAEKAKRVMREYRVVEG